MRTDPKPGGEWLTWLLEQWAEWLHRYYAPVCVAQAAPESGPTVGTVFESSKWFGKVARTVEVSNPVLESVISIERRGLAGPHSVHRLVRDMPEVWQGCLLGSAIGLPQAEIAAAVGIKQQRVSETVLKARSSLAIALEAAAPVVVARVRRVRTAAAA